jgi:predicted molibdopterin-dependent oxidoreductase YjgC
MEITPEIRQAVLDAECVTRGHEVNVYEAIRPSGPTIAGAVASDDDLKLPSMSCQRCGRTWVVIPAEGTDYEDAERRLFAMLSPESNVAKDLLLNRSRRIERDSAS